MTFDQWCKISGLSNIEIADKLDVSANYVSMLRHGKASPSSALMCEIYEMSGKKVSLDNWGFW